MARTRRRSRSVVRLEYLEARALLTGMASDPPSPIEVEGPRLVDAEESRPDNSLIVMFRPETTAEAREAALSAVGGRLARAIADVADVVNFGPGTDLDLVAAALASDPSVQSAGRNRRLEVAAIPNDPGYSNTWALGASAAGRMNAPAAWDITTGSATTIVAVTDSGVDYNHPDLYLNISVNQRELPASMRARVVDTNADGLIDFHDFNSLDAARGVVRSVTGAPINAGLVADANADGRISGSDLLVDARWSDGVDGDGNGPADDLVGMRYINGVPSNRPYDDFWHGTHVAGTIGAIGNNGVGLAGVAWNVRILPLKFLSASGNGTTADAVSAIVYAADQGAKVINASWGGSGLDPYLEAAVDYAAERGTVFVAAAGNATTNIDSSPFTPASIRSSSLISVAAINSGGALAYFSNYGPETVDVAAPGEGIYSTIPGGGYMSASGTSMAAPHVAGLVALLASRRPDLSAEQLVSLVKATATPTASLASKVLTSSQVDAAAALSPPAYAAPATLSATPAAAAVTLGWGASAGAAGYTVERSADGVSGWSAIAALPAGTTTYDDATAPAGLDSYYRVRATGNAGLSIPSPVAAAAPARASQALFVAADSTTQGNWVGQYGAGGYALAGGAAWTFGGSAGVATNGSVYTSANGTAPEGSQVFFLQRTGTASQVIAGWPAGAYTISLKAAQRANNASGAGNDFRVLVDGVAVAIFRPSSTAYSTYTTPAFTVADGAHTIAFQGINSAGGDNTALIDDLLILPASSSAVAPAVAGFEAPGLPAGGFAYSPAGSPWAFSPTNAGISANASVFTSANPPAPEGSQVLFLRHTGSASQSITGWPAGTYSLSFKAARRASHGTSHDFRVLVDGHVVATFNSTSTAYSTFSTPAFSVAAGTHSIAFQGINSLGVEPSSSLLDDIKINRVDPAGIPTRDAGFELPTLASGFAVAPSTLRVDPSWTSPTMTGETTRVWAGSMASDPGPLVSAASTSRIAADWTAPEAFTLDVPISGTQGRRVTLYLVDWDTGGARSQRIEVLDPATGAVLDTREISSFQNGLHMTWEVAGAVRFRITGLSGHGAVLSGVFHDTATTTPPPVSLTAVASSATAINLAWSVAEGATGYTIERQVDGQAGWAVLGTTAAAATTYRDAGLAPGTTYRYRVRSNGSNGTGLASPAAAATTGVVATATYLGSDAATKGNWVGAYGTVGYRVAGGAWSLTSAASAVASGATYTNWAATTTNTVALRRSRTDTTRVAATIFSGSSFTVDVPIRDGSARKVSLYLLDWNGDGSRSQRIEVINTTTGAILDTRDISGFQNGLYLTWRVTGPVRFRITKTGAANAVLSGIFLD